MKKFYLIPVAFFIFSVNLKAGEPVPGAEVIVEQEPHDDPIAYQLTGSTGTVTLDNLDKGKYRIFLVVPQLSGKYVKGKDKVKSDLKSIFSPEKRTYFLREPQGFFAVKFDGLKRIAGSNIHPSYKKIRNSDKEKLLIAEFVVTQTPGEVTIKVEAITPKEFENKAKKTKHDTAKATINNIR